MNKKIPRTFIVTALFLYLILGGSAYAASGTIDAVHKYAWSNIGGWINFAPTMSTVTVTDTELTGYVWGVNEGWINLSPSEGGVLNDGNGNLSGHAWSETSGWISFAGVQIDPDGLFSGEATGTNGYILSFDCTNCEVETNWRPAASTPSTTPHTSQSHSGSTLQPIPPTPSLTEVPTLPPTIPTGFFPDNPQKFTPGAGVGVYATNSPALITQNEGESPQILPKPPVTYESPALRNDRLWLMISFSFFGVLLLIIGLVRFYTKEG